MKKIVIKMPYGDVEILSKEDAIYFIKNRCNNCQHSTNICSCSGYQASLCEEKEKQVIEHLKKWTEADSMADFDREQAEQELYEKMLSELQAFRESLLKLTPADIIGNYNPYELIYKEDLLMCFEDDELCLTDGDIQLLLGMDKPLNWLYQSWCDSSVSHMDMLREFIRNTVQTQEAHND